MPKYIYTLLGASNHSLEEREAYDYYATDPKCAYDLIAYLPKLGIKLNNIWECACGEGHLAKVFDEVGKLGKASDLINRNYGQVEDFLAGGVFDKHQNNNWQGDIVTNPPYKLAKEFLLKALNYLEEGRYYIAFLKLTFLEGKERGEVFKENPPKWVLVYSNRQFCAKNGKFKKYKTKAICYAWFIWQKGYKGDPTIKWLS